jgi:hypothetical protein
MELILKSDNIDKLARIIALAQELGISIKKKGNTREKAAETLPPTGKVVSSNELLKIFGEAPDFPSAEEIRTKAWPSAW